MNLVNDRVPVIRGERDISNRVAHTYWERGYSSAGFVGDQGIPGVLLTSCTQGRCWMSTL